MKPLTKTFAVAVAGLSVINLAHAQTSSTTTTTTTTSSSVVAGGTNAARTDIYHVHVVHASTGKAAELGESFKSPGPPPAPDHTVVFRHQYGDSWDYTVIGHYGSKLTIEAARQQIPESQRGMSDSHTDTICNGPSWTEFSRVMGLDDTSKSKAAVYVVSFYRVTPGQREAAEKNLAEPPDPAIDKTAGVAILQHLEGAAWNYCGIVRYNSWQDLATSEVNSVPKTSDKNSPWSQLRNFVFWHTDTLCDRIQP